MIDKHTETEPSPSAVQLYLLLRELGDDLESDSRERAICWGGRIETLTFDCWPAERSKRQLPTRATIERVKDRGVGRRRRIVTDSQGGVTVTGPCQEVRQTDDRLLSDLMATRRLGRSIRLREIDLQEPAKRQEIAERARRLAERLADEFQLSVIEAIDATSPADELPAKVRVTPAHRQALTACEEAISRKPDLADAPLREVYAWICEHDDDYDPPRFESFTRYRRKALQIERGGLRNTLRVGRTHGRSIVDRSQI